MQQENISNQTLQEQHNDNDHAIDQLSSDEELRFSEAEDDLVTMKHKILDEQKNSSNVSYSNKQQEEEEYEMEEYTLPQENASDDECNVGQEQLQVKHFEGGSIVDLKAFSQIRMYQVMVSSFRSGHKDLGYGIGYGPSNHRGDLIGITHSLDYIKSMHFNAIWLTPIFDSSSGFAQSPLNSTGYFCNDYFKIDPHFGTEDDFRDLVKQAHERGLYVFLDGVFGHHGGIRNASPKGNFPKGNSGWVSYPESLDFFKEVAEYWIEEFEIDGWRLDQCYQLYQNGHNYLKDIRQTIEETCARRRAQGKEWGVLGYVVGEHWSDECSIARETYGQGGLRSAFDFPARYNLVQAIAMEESGAGGYGAGCLARIYRTHVLPNMFIGNHDVWRLGNLIKNKHAHDPEHEEYWHRHKLAIAALACYTGPITVYYGEEYGDIAEDWNHEEDHDYGDFTGSDNVGRTDGKIHLEFTEEEKDLKEYTSLMMKIRDENPALWRGTDSCHVHCHNNVLLNFKYDPETQQVCLFAINLSEEEQRCSFMAGGTTLTDLITNTVFKRNEHHHYNVTIPRLSSYIFLLE